MLGLIGEKLGMTQVYEDDGSVVPVTVVKVTPNTVVGVKSKDKHGYAAVQLAARDQKESRLNKPQIGQFKKIKVSPKSVIKEFRTDRAVDFKVGQEVSIEHLVAGDKINVCGRSKGKGFQGVMRLYNFAGGCDSHGTSVAHRVPGSIGQGTYPGKVIKNTKLPRHMGDDNLTVKNLKIVGIEAEQNILLVKGALPGARSATVFLYPHSAEFESKVLAGGDDKAEGDAPAKEQKENTGEAAA